MDNHTAMVCGPEAAALGLADRIAQREQMKAASDPRKYWLQLYGECLAEVVAAGEKGRSAP